MTAAKYGAAHRRTRAAWAPLVAAGGTACWRCGRPIGPGEEWDLGHDDAGDTVMGPEHRHRTEHCLGNRADGFRRSPLGRRIFGDPAPPPAYGPREGW